MPATLFLRAVLCRNATCDLSREPKRGIMMDERRRPPENCLCPLSFRVDHCLYRNIAILQNNNSFICCMWDILFLSFPAETTILKSHSHISQTDKARIREGRRKAGFHYTRGFAPNPVNTVKFLCATARMTLPDYDCLCLLEVSCEGG